MTHLLNIVGQDDLEVIQKFYKEIKLIFIFILSKRRQATVYPKMIQELDFVSLSEQIWRNVTCLSINGSSVVNGCRQSESSNS